MEIKVSMEEIKNFIQEEMRNNIDSVIKGDKNKVLLQYAKPNDVISYVKSIIGTSNYTIDSEGWQWKYKMSFDIDGKTYTLTGDGYFQDSAMFKLEE